MPGTLSFRDVEDLLAERGIVFLRDGTPLGETRRIHDRGGPWTTPAQVPFHLAS